MNPKLILIPFGGQDHQIAALEYGLRLAHRQNAQASVWHVSFDPQYMTIPYGLYDLPIYAEEAYKEIKQINRINLQAARDKYAEVMKKVGIQNAETSFHTVDGLVDEVMEYQGRTADLIIAVRPSDNMDDGARQTSESCLFSTGHPVIFVPPGKKTGKIKDNVLISWNGSAQAARAVTAALPFLNESKVKILVGYEEKSKELLLRSASNLAQYLKFHGIEADIITTPKKDPLLPGAILEKALLMDAGLIVMGAYTHTKLRESILGGVTQYMLKKATIPVLMSH